LLNKYALAAPLSSHPIRRAAKIRSFIARTALSTGRLLLPATDKPQQPSL
jgi:hypothetical protein